jgi:hypothetical protein
VDIALAWAFISYQTQASIDDPINLLQETVILSANSGQSMSHCVEPSSNLCPSRKDQGRKAAAGRGPAGFFSAFFRS